MIIKRKREPQFSAFFPRGAVGGWILGELKGASTFKATDGKDRGAVKILSRVFHDGAWHDVIVSIMDKSIAEDLMPLCKGTPAEPSIVGQRIVIAVCGVNAKGWNTHHVGVCSSDETLLEEFESTPEHRQWIASFPAGKAPKLSAQFWYPTIDGQESLSSRFAKYLESMTGKDHNGDDNIPF